MAINYIAFNAAVDKVKEHSFNLEKVSQARTKLKQEEEKFKLDKQESQLRIKRMQDEGRITETQADNFKAMSDMALKQQNTILQGQKQQVLQEQEKQLGGLRESTGFALRSIQQSAVGPGGQTIQGQGEGQTPAALGPLSQGIPAESNTPYITETGGVGYKKTKFNDEYFNRIQQAEAQGIPLNPDEQQFKDKYMGIRREKAKEADPIKYNDILAQAEKLAKIHNETANAEDKKPIPALVRQYLPEARKLIEEAKSGKAPEAVPEQSASTPSSQRIEVIAPDGKRYTVPESQLKQALDAGYKRAK